MNDYKLLIPIKYIINYFSAGEYNMVGNILKNIRVY